MSEEVLKENKMGVMPMPKLMLSMGLPMIISMIVQAFYNIVDSYFVSRITDDTVEHMGEYAVNALTLAYPVQLLIIAVGVGTGVGINALLSRSLGEKNFERAGKIAGNAIFIGLCTYIVFMLFGFFGTDAFLKTQTHDSLALKLGGEYLGICCVLSFGAVGSMIFEKLLQATGKTIHSTIAQLVGAIANIVLDPVLIFGLGPFPELGVKGAAYATVIGQVLTMVIGGVLHFVCNKEIPSGMRYFIPQSKMIANIYRIGIPAIIIQALMSVMTYGLNVILNRIGQSAVTAYGIYYKIQQFVFFASFGMNNTIIPVVSYNYGKGDKTRVRSGIKYGMLYTLGLMLLGIIGLFCFSDMPCILTVSGYGDIRHLCHKDNHFRLSFCRCKHSLSGNFSGARPWHSFPCAFPYQTFSYPSPHGLSSHPYLLSRQDSMGSHSVRRACRHCRRHCDNGQDKT